jgi:hypothetical protein
MEVIIRIVHYKIHRDLRPGVTVFYAGGRAWTVVVAYVPRNGPGTIRATAMAVLGFVVCVPSVDFFLFAHLLFVVTVCSAVANTILLNCHFNNDIASVQ